MIDFVSVCSMDTMIGTQTNYPFLVTNGEEKESKFDYGLIRAKQLNCFCLYLYVSLGLTFKFQLL